MILSEIHFIGARTQELLVADGACPALAAAGIRLCGVSDTATPYRMERPRLEFAEILGVLAGEGRVWLRGEGWRTVRAGDCYLAPRGAAQGFYPAPGRRWRIAWVHYAEPTQADRTVGGAEVTYLIHSAWGISPSQTERAEGEVLAVGWRCGKFTCVALGPKESAATWRAQLAAP